MNVKAKGYVLGVIAAATYGMNPLFALPLYEAGMNPDSVLFFRYLFAIPVLGAMIKLRGRDFKLKRKEILPLVIMGLLVALSSLTLFQSYNYMAAGIPGLGDKWRHLPGDVSRRVDASYHACDFYRFEAFVPERGSPGGTEAIPVNRRQLCVRSVSSRRIYRGGWPHGCDLSEIYAVYRISAGIPD